MLRPQLNPTVSLPASLFQSLPVVEIGQPRTTLLGAVYAYGANASVSGRQWDARAAFIDTSPLRTRRIFAQTNPPRFNNVVVGAGVTPVVGVRVGGSVTHGGWERAGESPAITQNRDATIVTIESEVSYRYSRLLGEWVRDTIETGAGDVASAADGGQRARHEQDHGQLSELDAEVEREQRPAQRLPRQPELAQHVGEAETVHQAEDERNPGTRVAAMPADQVVSADEDDTQRDRRLDQACRWRHDAERRQRQRDAVPDGERGDDASERCPAAAEEQQSDEEQDVVWSDQDVLNP
jgi:hypothetical protein